jgi:hypothetical protein
VGLWNLIVLKGLKSWEWRLAVGDSILLCLIHVGEFVMPVVSEAYPDAWVVLNCVVGAAHFALLFLYYNYRVFAGDVADEKKSQ